MDRDEARKLLKGGNYGIAEWKRRRETGEEIPNLRGADVRFAKLSGANVRGATLVGANLRRADLLGANLHDAALANAACDWTVFGNVDPFVSKRPRYGEARRPQQGGNGYRRI